MSENKNLILDANDRPEIGKWFALSFQHVFAMFSATVLVPLLTGLQYPLLYLPQELEHSFTSYVRNQKYQFISDLVLPIFHIFRLLN